MRTSFISFVALAILLFSTLSFTCGRDYVEPKPVYEFAEKLTLSPSQKEYAVNDTIWVGLQTTDRTLFDQLSNSRIATDSSYLNLGFYYSQEYPISSKTTGMLCEIKALNVADFAFTQTYNYLNLLRFSTNCAAKQYFFRVGFVPKQIGTYSIRPTAYLDNCPSKLTRQQTTFKLTFDVVDCNKDIFLAIPPGSRGGQLGYTDLAIDRKEEFFFRVN